ncbi:MAG TPA: hypothetical protein VI753_11600, partial [Anaerolineales bacterium]|nr:hypothetical protein [Anaerolineales bacterium]
MTTFAFDEDYLLLQNQPPSRAKISAFARLQGTHRPHNALQPIFSRNSSIRQNLARPAPGKRFRGLRTGTSYSNPLIWSEFRVLQKAPFTMKDQTFSEAPAGRAGRYITQ